MKNLKCLFFTFCLFITVLMNAQKIEHEGKEYHVKGEKIFFNKLDITANLTTQQLADIKNKLKNKLDREERISIAEKARKKAEKKQKQAEKELKKKKKAESNLSKSQKKYKNDLKKYEKMKRKGKLSSEDEEKWLKKLEKLQEKIEKNTKKLKRL